MKPAEFLVSGFFFRSMQLLLAPNVISIMSDGALKYQFNRRRENFEAEKKHNKNS